MASPPTTSPVPGRSLRLRSPATPPMPVTPVPLANRRKPAALNREWLVVSASSPAPVCEEIGKHAMASRTGLLTRDLRVLDPLLAHPSTILGRERAIVVCLEHVRAVITAEEVLIANPRGPLVEPLARELQVRVSSPPPASGWTTGNRKTTEQNGSPVDLGALVGDHEGSGIPFEFKALEACLESACRLLEDETKALETEAQPALDELMARISTLNLENVRQLKSRLVDLSGRVQKVRDELEHLLDDDDDMDEMYLTRKLSHNAAGAEAAEATGHSFEDDEEEAEDEASSRQESDDEVFFKPDVQELEMLLDAYFVQIEGTLNRLSHLRDYVDDTEDYINIMLDDKQNQLLQMGVMLTTATVVVTAAIMVTAVFGMNIHIPLYDNPQPDGSTPENTNFWLAVGGMVSGSIVLYLLAIYWGKKSKILQ